MMIQLGTIVTAGLVNVVVEIVYTRLVYLLHLDQGGQGIDNWFSPIFKCSINVNSRDSRCTKVEHNYL